MKTKKAMGVWERSEPIFLFFYFFIFFFGDWAALSALRRVMGDGGAVRKADDETNAGGWINCRKRREKNGKIERRPVRVGPALRSYRVVPSFTRFYWVLPSFPGSSSCVLKLAQYFLIFGFGDFKDGIHRSRCRPYWRVGGSGGWGRTDQSARRIRWSSTVTQVQGCAAVAFRFRVGRAHKKRSRSSARRRSPADVPNIPLFLFADLLHRKLPLQPSQAQTRPPTPSENPVKTQSTRSE